jgi:predicted anti-sigma-YlaC factor YlaD
LARACSAVAPWLADRARGRPIGAETVRVEEHLAACVACRETVAALALISRTESAPRPDLWPRLAARLESGATPMRLLLPTDLWGAALAATVLIAVSWLVPGARNVTTLMLFGVVTR